MVWVVNTSFFLGSFIGFYCFLLAPQAQETKISLRAVVSSQSYSTDCCDWMRDLLLNSITPHQHLAVLQDSD